MSSPASRTQHLIAIGEFIESLRGKRVFVSQSISWRPGSDFERHSTIHMRFSFLVQSTSWAMSGGHFMLNGENEELFTIGTMKLDRAEIAADKATVIEVYGECAERKSVIEVQNQNA